METVKKSEEFIVTARKWRPLKFNEVVGQGHITNTLKNSIKSGRVHHAYLFSGPRGVGKTTTARILARAVNCQAPEDYEPCNECEPCVSILGGRSMDVIEIDGASNNSVEDVRKLRENAKYPPVSGNYKLYIIDEVHMLSTSAFNALLKTLEEPPPHLLFVFATTEIHKVPATIISRCQRHEFRRIEIDNISAQLKLIAENENIKIDQASLLTISKKADGSMRDAQSIFDQVAAFCGQDITYEAMADALHLIGQEFYFRITKAIKEKDINEMFALTKEIVTNGYGLQEALGGLLEHFRNILAAKVAGDASLIEGAGPYGPMYLEEAENFDKATLARYMALAGQAGQALRFAPQPRVKFELALIQLATMDSSVEIEALLKELSELKKKFNSGVAPTDKASKETDKATKEEIPNQKEEAREKPIAPGDVKETTEESPPKKGIVKEPPPAPGVSAESLKSNWADFLASAQANKYNLMILKQDGIFPEFFKGEIILKVNSEFIEENLRSRKQNIIEAVLEYFGESAKIKIVFEPGLEMKQNPYANKNISDENSAISGKEKKEDSSKENNSADKEADSKHPVENAIIEIFGGEEMRG